MLKSRIYQLRLAQHDAKHGRLPPIKNFFWDRSMIGDYIFALWYDMCIVLNVHNEVLMLL